MQTQETSVESPSPKLVLTPREGWDLLFSASTMGNMAGFHRIFDKTKRINDCGCFCYHSSASQVVIFIEKKPSFISCERIPD